MSKARMLHDRHAVVFGGGGSIGAAVAKELASEGAEVFLAGRSSTSVDRVAKQITTAGGRAHSEVVDALDATAVDDYVAAVVQQAGSIDIEFNATGPRVREYGHGKPVVELAIDEFMTPVATVLRSQFITARAAARQMVEQGSGVIIFLTAIPARAPIPGSSGIGAAYGAVETVMRTMAVELGPAGVRVVCLRTTANPDTRSIQDATEVRAGMLDIAPEQAMARLAEATMLKVLPQTTDTARAAAFLASDGARMMTGTVLNASAGAVTD
jgi:3-oxoacyl-[acyl-carrier protein] reductase